MPLAAFGQYDATKGSVNKGEDYEQIAEQTKAGMANDDGGCKSRRFSNYEGRFHWIDP